LTASTAVRMGGRITVHAGVKMEPSIDVTYRSNSRLRGSSRAALVRFVDQTSRGHAVVRSSVRSEADPP
jgi:hypothetical protein